MFCWCPIENPMFFGGDEFARTVDIGAVQDEYGSWLMEQFEKEAAEIAAGMPAEDAEDFDAEEVLGVRYDECGDGSMWTWLSERYDEHGEKATMSFRMGGTAKTARICCMRIRTIGIWKAGVASNDG